MKFACRTCRKEVTLGKDGTTSHLDGTPACVFEIAGTEMPNYDRHEVVEDESTLVKSSKEEVKTAKKGG